MSANPFEFDDFGDEDGFPNQHHHLPRPPFHQPSQTRPSPHSSHVPQLHPPARGHHQSLELPGRFPLSSLSLPANATPKRTNPPPSSSSFSSFLQDDGASATATNAHNPDPYADQSDFPSHSEDVDFFWQRKLNHSNNTTSSTPKFQRPEPAPSSSQSAFHHSDPYATTSALAYSSDGRILAPLQSSSASMQSQIDPQSFDELPALASSYRQPPHRNSLYSFPGALSGNAPSLDMQRLGPYASFHKASLLPVSQTPSMPASLPSSRVHTSTDGLIPTTAVPPEYQSVFAGYSHFNKVQSACFDAIFNSDCPAVISAPTGSGKTAVFEIAMVRLLAQKRHNFKVVYMAPIKALCAERFEDWRRKFTPLSCKCMELTGDSDVDDFRALRDAQIILTTPEKWDSMTRKWKENKSLVQDVALFLIDEVHILNDEARGATLEAVVSRMKTVQRFQRATSKSALSESSAVRILALSATIPNIDDIGEWIGSTLNPARVFQFDESHRPVKLDVHVLAYPDAGNDFKFDMNLNYRLLEVIRTYSGNQPTLVFCSTRKGAQQAADRLHTQVRYSPADGLIRNPAQHQRLHNELSSFKDKALRECLSVGVGFHHAGLDLADRRQLEALFLTGDLPVLCATTTLAMGVNLPAHLVVIKSTQHYDSNAVVEYSEPQVLQMIGRAGRPQFDTSAVAVIMTRQSTKAKYESLLGGKEMIESNLHRHLIEHLNAEIVLQTISDISIAIEWIKSTFLFIRVRSNPRHYGIRLGLTDLQLERELQELCLRDIKTLAQYRLISMDDELGLAPTETGKLMARYCVLFESMKRFIDGIKPESTLEDLIVLLSHAAEFEDIRLRMAEKKTLNAINSGPDASIRFPVQGKIKTRELKINCLIQCTLGNVPLSDFSLAQDRERIMRAAIRIGRCIAEYTLSLDGLGATTSALVLSKCLRVRLWENSPFVSKQLNKIGERMSITLAEAKMDTFEKIENAKPMEIEMIVARNPPFGKQLREAVSKLPKYSVDVIQEGSPLDARAVLKVSVCMKNAELVTTSPDYRFHWFVILVGQKSTNRVLLRQKLSDVSLLSGGNRWAMGVDVKRHAHVETVSVCLISEIYVGLDVEVCFVPKFLPNPSYAHSPQTTVLPGKKGAALTIVKLEKRMPSKQKANILSSSDTATTPSASSTPATHSTSSAGLTSPTEPSTASAASVPTGNCAHTCADKSLCRHKCCKGIISKRTLATKRAASELHANNQSDESKTRVVATAGSAATGETALSELRSKSASIPETGVKRLRLQQSTLSAATACAVKKPPAVSKKSAAKAVAMTTDALLAAAQTAESNDMDLLHLDDVVFDDIDVDQDSDDRELPPLSQLVPARAQQRAVDSAPSRPSKTAAHKVPRSAGSPLTTPEPRSTTPFPDVSQFRFQPSALARRGAQTRAAPSDAPMLARQGPASQPTSYGPLEEAGADDFYGASFEQMSMLPFLVPHHGGPHNQYPYHPYNPYPPYMQAHSQVHSQQHMPGTVAVFDPAVYFSVPPHQGELSFHGSFHAARFSSTHDHASPDAVRRNVSTAFPGRRAGSVAQPRAHTSDHWVDQQHQQSSLDDIFAGIL